MTSGEPSGPSAAKFGGYTLIGVGALAAVVGVTTAFTGGTQNNAEGPAADPPSSSAPSPNAPLQPEQPGGSGQSGEAGQPGRSDGSSQPGNGGQPGESGQADGTGQAGQPGQPGDPTSPGQQDPGAGAVPGGQEPGGQEPGGNGQGQVVPGTRAPDGSQQANSEITVRVYNNSTVQGLAHRAAEDFRAAGYDVPQVGNYPSGKIPTTTVYFRPGTEEQAQAQQVADRFGARAEPRFEGLEPASPGVIALITDDYKGPQ